MKKNKSNNKMTYNLLNKNNAEENTSEKELNNLKKELLNC